MPDIDFFEAHPPGRRDLAARRAWNRKRDLPDPETGCECRDAYGDPIVGHYRGCPELSSPARAVDGDA